MKKKTRAWAVVSKDNGEFHFVHLVRGIALKEMKEGGIDWKEKLVPCDITYESKS